LKEKLYRLNFGWEPIVLVLLVLIALTGSHNITTSPNQSFVTQIANLEQAPNEEEIKKANDKSNPVENRREIAFILFRQLYSKNQELATELGKIPEFADNEIGEGDLKGLKNFTQYYLNSNSKTEANFKEILNVGKREYRKFCSPLQAAFWLAEKGEIEKFGLDRCWYGHGLLTLTKLDTLFQLAWCGYQEEKWKDFDTVVDRLNSPELISIWMLDNLKFVYHPGGKPYSPQYFFKIRKGDCKDYAAFATYCLRRNGYKNARTVTKPTPHDSGGHWFCVYTENAKFYAIDNGRIVGPKTSYGELIKTIKSYH